VSEKSVTRQQAGLVKRQKTIRRSLAIWLGPALLAAWTMTTWS